MALPSCFACPMIIRKVHCRIVMHKQHQYKRGLESLGTRLSLSPQRIAAKLYGQHMLGSEVKHEWSFPGGLRITMRPKVEKCIKSSGVCHSCFSNSQIATSIFTLGTAAVLPFYTLMVAAPKAQLTKKTMRSNLPYVGLGLVYAYLLWLSWTPDTIGLMFASKYWLPELQGIAKMFSNEITLASAWIHLLVVDLFAARQVYQDGLENEVETRHSVSLCLLFCPIGIISHAITKQLINKPRKY